MMWLPPLAWTSTNDLGRKHEPIGAASGRSSPCYRGIALRPGYGAAARGMHQLLSKALSHWGQNLCLEASLAHTCSPALQSSVCACASRHHGSRSCTPIASASHASTSVVDHGVLDNKIV